MTESHELSIHDLETERVEMLPGREALGRTSLSNWNSFNSFNSASLLASNSSLALNAVTSDSLASANALQTINFVQG